MTILVHIVGPQGSGKSSLIRSIVGASLPGQVAWLQADEALGLSNAEIRSAWAPHGVAMVFVEADFLSCRHRDLQAGDRVLQLVERQVRDAA